MLRTVMVRAHSIVAALLVLASWAAGSRPAGAQGPAPVGSLQIFMQGRLLGTEQATVTATPEDTLATYADGTPAVAMRRSEKGIDVFVGVPQLTPELLRALARPAGVHLFTEGKATVWAAEGFLSVQAHESGPLRIDVGRKGAVVDAGGRVLASARVPVRGLPAGEPLAMIDDKFSLPTCVDDLVGWLLAVVENRAGEFSPAAISAASSLFWEHLLRPFGRIKSSFSRIPMNRFIASIEC